MELAARRSEQLQVHRFIRAGSAHTGDLIGQLAQAAAEAGAQVLEVAAGEQQLGAQVDLGVIHREKDSVAAPVGGVGVQGEAGGDTEGLEAEGMLEGEQQRLGVERDVGGGGGGARCVSH